VVRYSKTVPSSQGNSVSYPQRQLEALQNCERGLLDIAQIRSINLISLRFVKCHIFWPNKVKIKLLLLDFLHSLCLCLQPEVDKKAQLSLKKHARYSLYTVPVAVLTFKISSKIDDFFLSHLKERTQFSISDQ